MSTFSSIELMDKKNQFWFIETRVIGNIMHVKKLFMNDNFVKILTGPKVNFGKLLSSRSMFCKLTQTFSVTKCLIPREQKAVLLKKKKSA